MTSILTPILMKVTLVLAVALVVTGLARRSSAAVRHLILAAAFAVLLALPFASFVAPPIPVGMPLAVQETIVSYRLQEIPTDVLPLSTAPVSTGAAATSPVPEPAQKRLTLSTFLVAAWVIVSGLFLLPIGAAMWQVHVLRKSGLPWSEGQAILDLLAAEAGMHRRIGVIVNDAVSGPVTCGVLRPAVLFPTSAQSWAEEDLRRAMIHELEHVRRFDWVTHCFARAVCACYWFQPLVWIAKRRLLLEAERACDDAVLVRSESTAYADQLVGLAERLSSASKHAMLAMASPGDLTMRVRAILDQRQRRTRAGMFRLAIVMATAAVIVIAASSLQMVTAAQQPGTKLTILSLIDGSDVLKIRGNELWFEHRNFHPPGKWTSDFDASGNEPTFINNEAWTPQWRGDASLPYAAKTRLLPEGSQVDARLVTPQDRGSITSLQQPSAQNNFTLAILLDDDLASGAAWYHVEIRLR